jgi:hypothetical protein
VAQPAASFVDHADGEFGEKPQSEHDHDHYFVGQRAIAPGLLARHGERAFDECRRDDLLETSNTVLDSRIDPGNGIRASLPIHIAG